jgi:hypothetical protein
LNEDAHPEGVIRNSSKFFVFTALNLLIILLLACHAISTGRQLRSGDAENAALAKRLGLTDLCLFTEARYTRHPAMADNHAAFQEHPSAFDHFPSGSFLIPSKKSGNP